MYVGRFIGRFVRCCLPSDREHDARVHPYSLKVGHARRYCRPVAGRVRELPPYIVGGAPWSYTTFICIEEHHTHGKYRRANDVKKRSREPISPPEGLLYVEHF